MNLKSAVKYEIYDQKRSIFIYYLIVISALLFFFLLSGIIPGTEQSLTNMGSLELATMIFLFVTGLNTFKETFKMFLQNSLSRKTLFLSRITSTLLISIFMALADKGTVLFGKVLSGLSENFTVEGLFENLYGQRYIQQNGIFLMQFEGFLFNICFYTVSTLLGYFLTVLYYRMKKGGKLAISVGLPVSLFVLLPIVDSTVFQGRLSKAAMTCLNFMFGFQHDYNPYYGIVTGLLLFILLAGLSWLLVKKAVVKD